MADLIRIKGGNGNVPDLQDRELAIKKNGTESELYCGIGGKNVRLCGAGDAVRIEALYTEIDSLKGIINTITARLDALEIPSE